MRPVSFSTAGLPREQVLERWEGHNEDALIGLRCRTLTADALDATETNLPVERLDLARVRGSSHVVERDTAMIRRRPTEAVALFFSLVGEAFYYHPDGVRTLRPGQLLVCDADEPFVRGFSQGLEELVVKVPRALFVETVGAATDGPRVLDFVTGNPVAHALARVVGAATRERSAVPVAEARLLELLAGLDGRTPLAHREAAYAHVERHLGDPTLSAASTAAAIGLSTRHLSRVLGETGTGFAQHVLRRRLETAHALLSAPEGAGLGVAEVAHRCGFASPAHFSGAFRRRFEVTASEVRRSAIAARSRRDGPHGLDGGATSG